MKMRVRSDLISKFDTKLRELLLFWSKLNANYACLLVSTQEVPTNPELRFRMRFFSWGATMRTISIFLTTTFRCIYDGFSVDYPIFFVKRLII